MYQSKIFQLEYDYGSKFTCKKINTYKTIIYIYITVLEIEWIVLPNYHI